MHRLAIILTASTLLHNVAYAQEPTDSDRLVNCMSVMKYGSKGAKARGDMTNVFKFAYYESLASVAWIVNSNYRYGGSDFGDLNRRMENANELAAQAQLNGQLHLAVDRCFNSIANTAEYIKDNIVRGKPVYQGKSFDETVELLIPKMMDADARKYFHMEQAK